MYVWLHVTVCVYKTAGVLIVASHLPHISTLSLCTCLLTYVHCGFSTSPAICSQPQIRAVYLTTVASSSAYKHTPSLPLCLFFTFFFLCWRNRKCCNPKCVVLELSRFKSCANPSCPSIDYDVQKADGVCDGVRLHTQVLQASAGIHTQTQTYAACVLWQATLQTPGNKHSQRERCMSGILLHNRPASLCCHETWENLHLNSILQEKLKPQAIKCTGDWQPSPPVYSSSLIHVPAAWKCLSALVHPAYWSPFLQKLNWLLCRLDWISV